MMFQNLELQLPLHKWVQSGSDSLTDYPKLLEAYPVPPMLWTDLTFRFPAPDVTSTPAMSDYVLSASSCSHLALLSRSPEHV